MRTFGSWAGALLLGAALGTGCDGAAVQPTVADGGRNAACAWAPAAPELTLAEGEVKGALRGSNRNLSTTCTGQKGTGGPEAIYLVRLTERTLLDIEVLSEMDTVLAIRRACDDPLTELACSDDTGATSPSPPPEVDAGAPLPGPDARNAHLRASLEAGNYFLLVDQAEPFGAGGEFRLDVRTSRPPTQTSCAGAPLVIDGSRLVDEELDLAHDFSPCAAGEPRPALFYRAVIPSGQRLTARALPIAGDREWTPVLQAFTSCGPGGASDAGANLCLASDQADAQGQPVLRYVNNGPTEETVLLAVSSQALVKNALFRLAVDMAQPLTNVTCQSALPLSDGLVVRNQDLAEGQVAPACGFASTPVPRLFYSARLYPDQSVRLSVSSPFPIPIEFSGREGCSVSSCVQRSDEFFYTNRSSEMRTVIIEVSSDPGLALPPFDLRAEMPLPPGGISVQAADVPQTSESGGQATFQVVLTSPGTELVEIPISSSDPQEGTVAPATLRFSPDNWDRPQMVTVTGVDDDRADGRRPYTVRIGPAVSNDPRYTGLEGRKVAVTNLDDEPGFRIDAPATLFTSESGANATFRVLLNRAPTATVRLPLSSSDEGEGNVSPAELVFEPDTWSRPQTVTVLGIDDQLQDGSQPYQVVIGAASSGDARYQGIDPEDLAARNADGVFQRGATPVNDPTVCDGGYYSSQVLAVDQATNLYVGLLCYYGYRPAPGEGFPTARVATSVDGGRSFGALVDTGLPVYGLELAGGSPGLVVAAGHGPQGIVITRSEDGGATWLPMRVLDPSNGIVGLAAAGHRVLVSTFWDTPGLRFWISDDGARTFGPPKSLDVGQGGWMGVDPDGTLWGFANDGRRLSFSTSNDGGMTFSPGPSFSLFDLGGPVAVGPTRLYRAAGKELQVVPRDGSAPLHTIATIPFSDDSRFSLLPDQRDNVTVLRLASGEVEAHRLNAGDSTFAPARALGPTFGWASAVPLSDRAIAVMLVGNGTASVAVETWP